MKTVTATQLRSNLYQLLDEVLSTGIPIDINKGKKKLRIVPVEAIDIFDKLIPHPKAVIGDANDLVDISWGNEVNLDLP